jgi:hypothetical protein
MRRLTLAICLIVSFQTCAFAQSNSPKVPRPTVAKASEILEPQPDITILGSAASFKHRSGAAVSAFISQGIVARIFSLRATESVPAPIDELSDLDCYVYISVAHRLIQTNTQSVRMETVSSLDHSWLSVNSDENKIAPGRYRIVLERPITTTVNQDYFRILRSHAPEYFKSGFVLVVSPGNNAVNLSLILENYNRRFDSRVELLNEYSSRKSQVPCYSIVPQNLQAGAPMELTEQELVACLPGPQVDTNTEPAG